MPVDRRHLTSEDARQSSRASAPRLALRKGEAARALGICDELFDAYVVPRTCVALVGRVRLSRVAELGRRLKAQADTPLAQDCRDPGN